MSGWATKAKAIVALAVALIGGLLTILPDNKQLQAVSAVVTAVATAIGVHQTPNAGVAPVQDVTDAVISSVPADVAPVVADAVSAAGGVLKDAVGRVGLVPEA